MRFPDDTLTRDMSLYTLQTLGQLEPYLGMEWLLTNGMGSFAGSSVVGCNTRRYHGLLCAATLPPVGRMMALSRVGEILILDNKTDRRHELSVNQFGQSFHPRGEKYLKTFELDGVARWRYAVENVVVTKELLLVWQQNIAMLRYTIQPAPGQVVDLQLLPFVSMRDFHSLRHADGSRLRTDATASGVSIFEGQHNLHLEAEGCAFVPHEDWWFGHTYDLETERGLDDTEDLFVPGHFAITARKQTSVTLIASLGPTQPLDWEAEVSRRKLAGPMKPGKSIVHDRLLHAAGDFIVKRQAPDGSMGTTILAGYPWFADWGRDTFISLPGLLLCTGRFKEAQQVLGVFAHYVSEGMIPNRFDDYTNHPEYNTVDASLWFIHACFEYLRYSQDKQTFETELRPACQKIIEGYRNGTRYHIRMDPADGLITQGDATTQLTWMDAKCGDVAFTPRQGKAVEINALWYHALRLMGENELAEKVQKSFRSAFWLSPFRGLADVVDGTRKDSSIRPNQIFAVSLLHSPLTDKQQQAVVEVVRRELLTPVGLRTLATSDPNFKPLYSGNQFVRDGAYHNGTIWPWPIGAFLEAYIKVNNRSDEAMEQAREWLRPLIDSLETSGCIGSISEIFEAEAPHRAVGCFAQAWSVAEVLRMAIELEM